MMIALNKKYRPFAVLSCLLVAMIGIAWYVIVPLRQALEVKTRGIQEYYAGRENRERQIGKLPEFAGQYDVIVAREKTLDILITEADVVDFIETLETLAGAMNVRMSIASKDGGKIIDATKKPAAKPVPAKKPGSETAPAKTAVPKAAILDDVPFDQYLSLSVTADGRYGDLVAFLRKIETLPYGLDIVRIEMKKEEKDLQPSITERNPFSILGDGQTIAVPAVSQAGEDETVEAIFDMLVYIKKTGL